MPAFHGFLPSLHSRPPRGTGPAATLQRRVRRATAAAVLRAASLVLTLAFLPASRAAPATDCPPAAAPLSAQEVEAGLRDARDRGFLWRIAKNGVTSYLYGTVHVAAREWMFPGPTVQAALAASETLALELDLQDPEVQAAMQRGMKAAPRTALPKPLQARLARQMSAACLPATAFADITPGLQVATLTLLAGRRDGLDPSYGIDGFLAGYARSAGKRVASLESPETQLQALEGPDANDTLAQVTHGLDDLERGRARPLLRRIGRLWAEGDFAQLQDYERWCDCLRTRADRQARARLLDERNPGLADAIDALHARGAPLFAAVGSLHMIGPTGLPTLLARRGYRVERVVYADKAPAEDRAAPPAGTMPPASPR